MEAQEADWRFFFFGSVGGFRVFHPPFCYLRDPEGKNNATLVPPKKEVSESHPFLLKTMIFGMIGRR